MSQNYTLITDSAADLSPHLLESMGVRSVPLNVFMKDNPAHPCTLTGREFYDALRAGKVACTSAANLSLFREVFGAELSAGRDILYLAFSSPLSCMYATGKLAAEELAEGRIQVVFDIPEDALTYGYAPDVCMHLNSDRLQALGWKPEVDLKEMFARLIASFRAAGVR